MHFLTSLIIIFGFTTVLCLVLVKVIGDLLKISDHGPPDVRATLSDEGVSAERP
jgi:hypothetical protein